MVKPESEIVQEISSRVTGNQVERVRGLGRLLEIYWEQKRLKPEDYSHIHGLGRLLGNKELEKLTGR